MTGDVARLARSAIRNFGIDPTIHPNAPRSTVNRRKLARVQATLSVRKNSPRPEALRRPCNRVAIVGASRCFRNPVVARVGSRYYRTYFVSQFKPLLTLLELRGVSLHDAAPGCGAEGTVRDGGIRNGKPGVARLALRQRLHRFGSGGGCHRRCRHGRRRRLHQPRLSGQGHPVRLFDPVAVDDRRHRRVVRGVFLR